MDEQNENGEYPQRHLHEYDQQPPQQRPSVRAMRQPTRRRPSVRDARKPVEQTTQRPDGMASAGPTGEDTAQPSLRNAYRVQVSGTIPQSGQPHESMAPQWSQRMSWEQRPSWARPQPNDSGSWSDGSVEEPVNHTPARPSVRDRMRETGAGSSNFQPRLGGGIRLPRPSIRKAGRPSRPSMANIGASVGQDALSTARGMRPAVLLCFMAAAVLLVWGLVHFIAALGSRTYEPKVPIYQSTSIVNQSAAKPRTFEQDSVEPLIKAAEEHKQAVFEARLGEYLQAQREHSRNIDLTVRDEYFKVGTSFPNNFQGNTEKILYLTFDDGPSGVTEDVLDILDRYDAKATFFVTNLMPEYQGLIREAYQRGHTIGMHTSNHDYARVYASVDDYFEDLNSIAATVERQIGYVPCFIRFPGGSSNTISANYTSGIMSELSELVQYRGYQYYDWNCEDGDARGNMSTQEIIDIALYEDAEAEGTNLIMLLHDANDKQTTVEALPTIIEHYMLEGYRFEALTPESLVYHQQIAN